MAQSAINAAESLHSLHGVPYANIELTPMIGRNDVARPHRTLILAHALILSASSLCTLPNGSGSSRFSSQLCLRLGGEKQGLRMN